MREKKTWDLWNKDQIIYEREKKPWDLCNKEQIIYEREKNMRFML
jgi:hypothetical protein